MKNTFKLLQSYLEHNAQIVGATNEIGYKIIIMLGTGLEPVTPR
jgi:hypothetical protein